MLNAPWSKELSPIEMLELREDSPVGGADAGANSLAWVRVAHESRFHVVHEFPSSQLAKLWREFLSRVDCPAHYNGPESFLEPGWKGRNPFAVLAFNEAKIVGVLTGFHMGGHVVSGLPSRPQVCIAKDTDPLQASDTLAAGLLSEAGRTPLIAVYSWNWTPLSAFERYGFWPCQLEGNIVLELCLGAEALFKQFHENRKRNIRAAIRNGIEVCEETTDQDLVAYWEVFSAWRKSKPLHQHQDTTFAMAEKVHGMRENRRRFLARYKGKVIAATGLRFFPGGLIEYSHNCSLDEFVDLRPNDLLLWRTIQWACEKGFSRYSLGGAHLFLRKSGGTVVPIYRYRLDRTFLHRHDLRGSVTETARRLFQRMPAPIKEAIKAGVRSCGHPGK